MKFAHPRGGRQDLRARYHTGDDYSDDEREFMVENRCPFPTCSEVLEVLKSLGYRKP